MPKTEYEFIGCDRCGDEGVQGEQGCFQNGGVILHIRNGLLYLCDGCKQDLGGWMKDADRKESRVYGEESVVLTKDDFSLSPYDGNATLQIIADKVLEQYGIGYYLHGGCSFKGEFKDGDGKPINGRIRGRVFDPTLNDLRGQFLDITTDKLGMGMVLLEPFPVVANTYQRIVLDLKMERKKGADPLDWDKSWFELSAVKRTSPV